MAGATSNTQQVVDAVDGLHALLADMTPANEAAAAIVLPLAVEQAPRLTGRLAASLRSVVAANSYGVESDLIYAPTVHARQPWIADVITAAEADQLRALDDYVAARIPA